MKKVIVLGASGSIGKNTLDIIRSFPERFSLAAFSVNTNISFAESLSKEFPHARSFIAAQQPLKKDFFRFICDSKADIAVNGIAGAAGLRASISCVEAGLDLALANKESIVMAGDLLQQLANKQGVHIIPVDSEHSAIFALINAFGSDSIEKIIITASGGPFRCSSLAELEQVSAEQALAHPTWNMGGKISIDSASLANKALEVIEAVKLFRIPPERIIVAVHPESIVHSMVQLKSGEVYAQCSPPDMRFPILQALEFPKLAPPYISPLDFSRAFSLRFEPPRFDDFPLLKLGFEAAQRGGAYPIAFNAANEVAVAKFLCGSIKFLDIGKIVAGVFEADWHGSMQCFEEVFAADDKARRLAEHAVERLYPKC